MKSRESDEHTATTTQTYVLGGTDQPWIKCLTCDRTSYHPKDISERYCGYCHKFHRQGDQ